jgi:YidC/Oxa1 family membrane protein insertase
LGVTSGEGLQEIECETVKEDRQIAPAKFADGLLGVTDKYWAAAPVPSVPPVD